MEGALLLPRWGSNFTGFGPQKDASSVKIFGILLPNSLHTAILAVYSFDLL